MRHDPDSAAVVIMLRSLKMHGIGQAVTDLIEQGAQPQRMGYRVQRRQDDYSITRPSYPPMQHSENENESSRFRASSAVAKRKKEATHAFTPV